jgi:alpha-D-ribose 1-methylphosphonate 5-triphosphate synthase subunit PhnH
MKRIYAEQVNKLLEDFHFNIEFENNSRALSFNVLQNGIQHIYGGAFCSGDTEATDALKPLLMQVIDGEVPQPIDMATI